MTPFYLCPFHFCEMTFHFVDTELKKYTQNVDNK